VRSDFPLVELHEWVGDDRAPDITVRLGRVPDRLDALVTDDPVLQLSADGTCRLARASVASCQIDGPAGEVIIEPEWHVQESDVRAFFLSKVLAALCLKRNLVPLHASAVQMGDTAVAFVGRSGVGKSTIAAACMKRGYRVLADDLTAVDWTGPAGPRVWSTFPLLKLCPDAIAHLDLRSQGAAPNTPQIAPGIVKLEKYHVAVDGEFVVAPVPVTVLCHLSWATDSTELGIVRLGGREAVRHALRSVYRGHMARLLMGQARLFTAASRLCSHAVLHVAARRSTGSSVDDVLDELTLLRGAPR
jgi:hypothetical protein